MCARFTLRRKLNLVLQELAELMLDSVGDWDPTPAFNICPTQKLAAVRPTADASRREVAPLKVGLIPSWSKDPKITSSCIYARGERVATKPASRSAFKKRRRLIAAAPGHPSALDSQAPTASPFLTSSFPGDRFRCSKQDQPR
jgi:putative SOS response-associated peptidase YedK